MENLEQIVDSKTNGNGTIKKQKDIPLDETEFRKVTDSDMETANQPKVLMYHRIVDDRELSNKEEGCLHVDDFKRQLAILDQLGYSTITFRDYHLFQQQQLQLPKKPIILTFDDGYEDIYRLAYPLLKEQGMKGVLFVLADRSIAHNRWDAEASEISKASLMNNDQILEMHANGFEIGSHTMSHANLERMDAEASYKEIHKSKLILEAMLNKPIISFCYPYGLLNKRVKKQVRRAGYEFACSSYSGPAKFNEDLSEIRRMEIDNSISLWGFLIRLLMPFEYVEWAWWKTKHKNGK